MREWFYLGVCSVMKHQGFKVNSVVCFIMLRLCFNKQRLAWWPGGYPPGKDSLVRKLNSSPPSPLWIFRTVV